MRKAICTYWFVFLISFCQAQHIFSLSGKVTGSQDSALAGSTIRLRTIQDGPVKFFAISRSDGSFYLKIPNRFPVLFAEISHVGYTTAIVRLAIDTTAEANEKLLVQLKSDTAKLHDVFVRAYSPITKNGDTTTIRVGYFKTGMEANVTELLNNIPGFSYQNGRISYNGKTITRVLVEDDDLFGQEYKSLVQNLPPAGIEKIQVIENYIDNTYLENKLSAPKETVINIKYEKRFFLKVLSTTDLAGGLDVTSYRVRQHLISLIPKFKFVTNANFNNNGITSSEMNDTEEQPVPSPVAGEPDPFKMPVPAIIPDIQLRNVPVNRSLFNATKFLNNNLLFKPGKKIIIRSKMLITYDRYAQFQQRMEDFRFSGLSLQTNQYTEINKKPRRFNLNNEIIYNVSQKWQMSYSFHSSVIDRDDTNPISTETVIWLNDLASEEKKAQHLLQSTFMLSEKQLLHIKTAYRKSGVTQLLNISPPVIWQSFNPDPSYDNVSSDNSSNKEEWTAAAVLKGRSRFADYSFSVNVLAGNSSFFTRISSYKTDDTLLFPQYDNNNHWNYSVLSTEAALQKKMGKKFTLSANLRLEHGRMDLANNNYVLNGDYLNALPSFALAYRPNTNSAFQIQWQRRNRLPQPDQVYNGLLISSPQVLASGSDTLNFGLSNTLSLNWFYGDMVKRKLIFFAIASVSNDQVLYLNDRRPGMFYSHAELIATDKRMMNWNFITQLSKYLNKIKTEIVLKASYINMKTFVSVNQAVDPIWLRSLSPSAKIRKIISKSLNASFEFLSTFNNQHIKGKVPRDQSSALYQYIVSSNFNKSNWGVNFQVRKQDYKAGGRFFSYIVSDATVKYVVKKEKLSLSLVGSNLFNRSSISTTFITPYSIIHERSLLLPRQVLLQATIQLH